MMMSNAGNLSFDIRICFCTISAMYCLYIFMYTHIHIYTHYLHPSRSNMITFWRTLLHMLLCWASTAEDIHNFAYKLAYVCKSGSSPFIIILNPLNQIFNCCRLSFCSNLPLISINHFSILTIIIFDN